jgi:hypothetical protein
MESARRQRRQVSVVTRVSGNDANQIVSGFQDETNVESFSPSLVVPRSFRLPVDADDATVAIEIFPIPIEHRV